MKWKSFFQALLNYQSEKIFPNNGLLNYPLNSIIQFQLFLFAFHEGESEEIHPEKREKLKKKKTKFKTKGTFLVLFVDLGHFSIDTLIR